MWIVIVGNPVDGFKMFGPFDTMEKARDWQEQVQDEASWATELQHPD
jgi:hypothetical protein